MRRLGALRYPVAVLVAMLVSMLTLIGGGCSGSGDALPSSALAPGAGRGVAAHRQGQASGFSVHVLDACAAFPKNTSYLWQGDGVTRDLFYQGTRVATPYAPNVCHCVGATFQIYLTAFENWTQQGGGDGTLGGLSVADVKKLRQIWYVATAAEEGAQAGLVAYGLGQAIALDDAQPGDFVQLWRNNGSGHAVVFDGWQRDANQQITGIRYFGCNSGGPGYQTEPVGSGTKDVIESRIYIGRANYPGSLPPDAGAPLADVGTMPSADSASPAPDAGPTPALDASSPRLDRGTSAGADAAAPAPPAKSQELGGGCAIAATDSRGLAGLLLALLALLVSRRAAL